MTSDSEIRAARYFRESRPISYWVHTSGAGIAIVLIMAAILFSELYVFATTNSPETPSDAMDALFSVGAGFVLIAGCIGLALCGVGIFISNSLRNDLRKADLKLSTEV